jgi:hypothetical protein
VSHKISHFDSGPFDHWARCRCGFTTKHHRTTDDCDDEVARHEADVERVRLALGTRNPTLKSQRDYYRQMSEDENVEPHDRRMWGILADELDRRLGKPITPEDQPTLI